MSESDRDQSSRHRTPVQATDSLQDSEARLELALRAAHMGMWHLDIVADRRSFDDQVCHLLGLNPEVFGGTSAEFFAAVHPDDREMLTAALAHTITQDVPYDPEYRVVWPDGSTHHIRARGRLSRDAAGRPLRVIGIIWEITQSKQSEAYREMGREILQILNESGDMRDSIQRVIAALKTGTGFEAVGIRLQNGVDFPYFVQQGFAEDFLVTEDTLVERAADGGVCRDKDGGISLECTCGQVISGKTDPTSPYVTRGGSCWTNDKADAPFHDTRLHPRNRCLHDGFQSVALVPIRSKDRIVGLIQINDRRKGRLTLEMVELLEGIASHVGSALERKRMEQALRESEVRYRALFEQASDAIWILELAGDRVGRILLANTASAKMHGYTVAEMETLRITDLDVPESVSKAPERFGKIAKGTSISGETLHVRKDGTVFPIDFSAGPIQFDGRPCVLAFSRDITERKRAEVALNNVQKLESLGLLAGGIAHDFNNLMGGVFGYIDMASEASTEEKVTRYLSRAMSTMDRARGLTQQLLTFASGGAPIQKVDYLYPFVQETAQFALSGSKVSCRFDVPENLWPCNFDKNQIGQVIDNLVINAQQAMPAGGTIELASRNVSLGEKEHPTLTQGNYVKISVKDPGIGIPKEVIARIFDPFFTTKAMGHGLGLATCYSIVNRHGGCIDVESEPGKGSTFHVFLPASTDAVSSSKEKVAAKHRGSGRILVMDDEEVMRETVGDMLQTLGYTVILTTNGRDAIDFFSAEIKANRKIAGMIFDLTVPGGVGGREAIRDIRKLCSQTPVYVASGYAQDPVMADPKEYGFTASIRKPFKKAELARMLEKHVKKRK